MLKTQPSIPEVINRAVREAARQANHEVIKYLINSKYNSDIDRTTQCPLHLAVSGILFAFLS